MTLKGSAQAATNEVRGWLEKRQQKFKEEAVKNVKGEMTYGEYIDSLSKRYDDVLHKIDVLYYFGVKICDLYHQKDKERKSLKVTIKKNAADRIAMEEINVPYKIVPFTLFDHLPEGF